MKPKEAEDFLKKYYEESIRKLGKVENKTLIINFQDLDNFDNEMSDDLIEHPDTGIKILEEALHNLDLQNTNADAIEDAVVAIRNLSRTEKTPIYRISSAHINQLIAVEGRIGKIGPAKPRLITAAFKCKYCDHINFTSQDEDGKYREPHICDSCERKGQWELKKEKSEWKDEQKFELQDLYELLNPGKPQRSIIIVARGLDLINSIPAMGAQVIITGIVRTVQKGSSQGQSSTFDNIIHANYIEPVEPDIDQTITEADKKEFLKLAKDPEFYQTVIEATAPTVLGYDEIKLALCASAVSGPNHTLSDGRQLRGYVHVVLCGDPGTAKTVMVESLRTNIPRSQYAAGRGASAAGLTVAVVRDELTGGYSAQAGALVLADHGLMVLDELDKFKPEDMQALNTVLETGKIHVNKGGLNQIFNARCPVIAISNPKWIRFDKFDDDFIRQIDIPADTLSRFDLIFKIQDIPDPEKDKNIAEHQGNLWQQLNTKRVPPVPKIRLTKYLAFAKSFVPAITKQVTAAITKYYLELRKCGKDTIAATARDNNAMYRLTISLAKLRLSNECSIQDVNMAIKIHKASLEAIRDPTTGKLDCDLIYGVGESQRTRIKSILQIIRDHQGNNGNTASKDDIKSAAKQRGISEEHCINIMHRLKEKGDIIEVDDGFYRVGK